MLKRELILFKGRRVFKSIESDEFTKEDVDCIKELVTPIVDNEKEKHQKQKRRLSLSYMDYYPLAEVGKAVNCLSNAVKLYDVAEKDISKLQRETQDILHAIEITELSGEDSIKYVNELRAIRIQRRIAKNFVESVYPIKEFAQMSESFVNGLKSLYTQITEIQNSIHNREYQPREKTTMQEAFEKSDDLWERIEDINNNKKIS